MPRPLARAFVLFVKELFGHLDKTITANDIDRFCCPYRLPATRARHLPGTRWTGKIGVFVLAQNKIVPAVCHDSVSYPFCRRCDAPTNSRVILNIQAMYSCRIPKPLIVICHAAACVFDVNLRIVLMDHGMQECCNHVFDRLR